MATPGREEQSRKSAEGALRLWRWRHYHCSLNDEDLGGGSGSLPGRTPQDESMQDVVIFY